jgi:thiol-disulfide isomerase/thioredoxin
VLLEIPTRGMRGLHHKMHTMTMTMKSVICTTLLLSLHPAHANTRPAGNRYGLFSVRRSWGSIRTAASSRYNTALVLFPRGGDGVDSAVVDEDTASTSAASAAQEEESLDDRVFAAMRRLGLAGDDIMATESGKPDIDVDDVPPPLEEETPGMNCEGGVCTIDEPLSSSISIAAEETSQPSTQEELYAIAERISTELAVPRDIVLAAIYSSFSGTDDNRQLNETAARSIIHAEIDAIAGVPEDCAEVKQLVEEGYGDVFFVRRSLAFSEMNVDDARAILNADREDEEAEQAKEEPEMKTVTVDYPKNFDPLASEVSRPPQQPKQEKAEAEPPRAKKEDVVFEGTAEELQKLVLESPVPVLLDVYADWCRPCQVLGPALESICMNAGGMLRLVKINTDLQRQVSGALDVKSLPTVFGIRDGKILNSFLGLPKDEQMMRDFLMGLMVPGQKFNPPVSLEDEKRYEELSGKLLKLATGASFSFASRELLQSHVGKLLNELVEGIGGDTGMAIADDSARVLRTIMSNVIAHPFDEKFRKIKLDNNVINSKVAQYQPCLAILKAIGFVPEGDSMLVVAKGKKVVNIALFVVARDCIDKWIDKNRYQIAAAGRKRKDEIDRARLAAEAEEAAANQIEDEEDEDDDAEEVVEESNVCLLRVRLDGKKKVHDVGMDADDTLSDLLGKMPYQVNDGEIVQLTCVAKRLVVKSTDTEVMSKTLAQLKLMPSASIVVKIGETADVVTKGSLAERAVSQKKKSTGSHSMHSIGLYSTKDGSKAEEFESGGVVYEHDVTDIEDEPEEVVEDKIIDDDSLSADESEQPVEGNEI